MIEQDAGHRVIYICIVRNFSIHSSIAYIYIYIQRIGGGARKERRKNRYNVHPRARAAFRRLSFSRGESEREKVGETLPPLLLLLLPVYIMYIMADEASPK